VRVERRLQQGAAHEPGDASKLGRKIAVAFGVRPGVNGDRRTRPLRIVMEL
jgi:hypothetical protein